MGAAMILEGGVNGVAFEASVEQVLAPTLPAGQTVVMDTLSVRKVARVQQLIEKRGGRLLFLPAYSPDFSPSE